VRRLDAALDWPVNEIGEITKNYGRDQSGVKPPHSKILAAPRWTESFSGLLESGRGVASVFT